MKYEIRTFLLRKWRPFLEFCIEKKRTVWIFTAIITLLCALQILSYRSENRVCLRDDAGRLFELRLHGNMSSASIPLTVEAYRDGRSVKTEALVTLQMEGEAVKTAEKGAEAEGNEDTLLQQVKEVVSELPEGENRILLPGRLEDGTRLRWEKKREIEPIAAILMILPLGMLFLYRDKQQKIMRARKKQIDEIRKGLPAFQDQLLLLLSSGLIFHDAFVRIAESFQKRLRKDALQKLIIEVVCVNRETGASLITVLDHHARELGVREFSRMVTIIVENQNKGVDLREKLESESAILWTQRKKLAEERGKAAETKLSFPLAILLMVLIVITASPAILEM